MSPEELKTRNFEDEFIFSSSRSSGPGGQNVNKVNTKVELRFSLTNTSLFSDNEKELISRKLKKKINKEGELILVSQSERTQLLNKNAVTEKFFILVSQALTLPLTRRSTRPTHASVNKRLEKKKIQGYIKNLRKMSGDPADD
jgi:ribosome-associated protein